MKNELNSLSTKLLLSLLFFTLLSCRTNQDVKINFKNKNFDFGEINFEDDIVHSFKFLNKGTAPLKIYYVKTTCSCTISTWPKYLIPKDSSGEITVRYNHHYDGSFLEKIIVYHNGKKSGDTLLIKGKIKKPRIDVRFPTDK
ncbi:Protein of unknown function [Tangfeifania diversioriginum]|uniref:DUF1573 domain-containing protein n=1 Tax=Tangfeifania diversioriginum TaxID=1168035 RepID=A0A1M6PCI7_9BACT|nr:DUF1573 domain-containing protein [Tangfeifania diversioriginum]SHK05659.1 Protein of unknown function [Tangfeifania diversioriginum]